MSLTRSSSRRRAALVAAGCVVALLAPVTGAQDDSSSDSTGASGASGSGTTTSTTSTSTSTSGTGSSRKSAESSVASLRKDRSVVRAELAAAEEARQLQHDRWVMFTKAHEVAQAEVERTEMLAERARRDLFAAQRRVRKYASEAFMAPPALETLAVLSIDDAAQAGRAHDLLSIAAEDQNSVVDELVAAEAEAQKRSKAATAAEKESRESAAATKAELDELEAALAEQRRLGDQVEKRLDSAMAEVAALEAVDKAAAAKLEAEERQLAEESRALTAGSSASDSTSTDSTPSTGTTTTTSAPSRSTAPPATAAPRPQPTTTTTAKPRPPSPPVSKPNLVTWQDVVKVNGIWVNKSIAGQVRSLVSAASAAGFSLSGGGYRDPNEQIRFRTAHCGPTDYDIYEKPARECTPPTAPPGRSMHERGLAIDFTSSGSLIESRSSPAFQWLAANAGSYGLYNLPSEPWHWSTNGN